MLIETFENQVVFSAILSNSSSCACYPNSSLSIAQWQSEFRFVESRGERNIVFFDRRLLKSPSPINLRPPAGGCVVQLHRVTWSTVTHCFAKWMFDSLMSKLLSGNYRQIRRHRVCENRPNIRLPVGIIGSPRVDSVTGSLCSSR